MGILVFGLYVIVCSLIPVHSNCPLMPFAATQDVNHSLLFSFGVLLSLVAVPVLSVRVAIGQWRLAYPEWSDFAVCERHSAAALLNHARRFYLPAYRRRPLAFFDFCLGLSAVALSRAFSNEPKPINGILTMLLLFYAASLWI